MAALELGVTRPAGGQYSRSGEGEGEPRKANIQAGRHGVNRQAGRQSYWGARQRNEQPLTEARTDR